MNDLSYLPFLLDLCQANYRVLVGNVTDPEPLFIQSEGYALREMRKAVEDKNWILMPETFKFDRQLPDNGIAEVRASVWAYKMKEES